MPDPNNQGQSNEPDVDLTSMMERIEQLDPTQLAELSPEQIQELFGGAKLGQVFSAFQQQAGKMAAELAKQQEVNLDQLDGDEDDRRIDTDNDTFSDDSIEGSLFARPSHPDGSFGDYPGSEQIWLAAFALGHDDRLQVSVEIKSPPVTHIEKIYYDTCHYRILFDLFDTKVTFRDVTTPRQDYLHGNGWPAMLSLPRKSWPDLEVLPDTIRVEQFSLREAFRSNSHTRIPRADLNPFAHQALTAALIDEQ